jgi:uncharacterized membrane protein YgcG
MIFRLFGLISLFIISPLLASEQILSFHSAISIQQDGQLHVLETIQVTAENQQIQRGIYRDFPTIYKGKFGLVTQVSFNVLSVTRDGKTEPYHIKKMQNGQRVYIGDQNVRLSPGEYSYQLEYKTDRQLGFFENYDELYWNVTGNGWNFPILQASADIFLPAPVDSNQVQLTGYTGAAGSTQQYLTHHIEESSNFYFETTQPLAKNEGLTIVANWPKGLINEPDRQQKRNHFIQDNRHSLVAVGGIGLVLIYYGLVWIKVGKDPEAGVIHPRYKAPADFSPASARFISQMAYDNSCFTAAIVNLAVKGEINIDRDSSGKFVITRLQPSNARLAAGEAAIIDKLFEASGSITLTRTEHKRLSSAIHNHQTSLREDYEKLYFLSNKKYFFPGIVISLATVVYSISQIPDQDMLSSTIFISFFALIPFIIIGQSFKRFFKRHKAVSIIHIAFQVVFFGIFFYVAGDMITQMLDQLDNIAWPVVISLYLVIASNILFPQWLKAPTLAGRRLLDEIEGFKLYLNVAEQDELNLSGQPRFSSDIYEKFLPYAIALGVGHAWTQKLERAINAGIVAQGYYPRGFLYHNEHQGLTGLSDSLSGSLNSAISSSSTAPGSSSGSSGGSSGGGGGGGGGGGW